MTEQAKHTPGPWFWAEDKYGRPTNLMRSGSGDYVLSPQADLSDYGLSCDRWTDISEADAHLIAAAPDLLDALCDVLGMIDVVCPEYAEATMCANARAAIAKAEAPAQDATR